MGEIIIQIGVVIICAFFAVRTCEHYKKENSPKK